MYIAMISEAILFHCFVQWITRFMRSFTILLFTLKYFNVHTMT